MHMYIYPVLLATDQAKAVGELTQHVRETTSKGSEQYAGETHFLTIYGKLCTRETKSWLS